MKFLFLTVALVHTALAASEQKHQEQDPQQEPQGLDAEMRFAEIRGAHNFQGCTNMAGVLRAMEANAPRQAQLDAMMKETEDKIAFNRKEFQGLDEQDSALMGEQITLQLTEGDEETSEDPTFTLTRKAASKMETIKALFVGDRISRKIPVKKDKVMSAAALAYAVDYVRRLTEEGREPAEIQKPIRSVNILECIDEADAADAQRMLELFAEGQGKRAVFDVILAANYLNIKSLLHLGCVQIATQIKGKSPAEIRAILGDDLGEDVEDDLEAMNGRRRLLEAMSQAL